MIPENRADVETSYSGASVRSPGPRRPPSLAPGPWGPWVEMEWARSHGRGGGGNLPSHQEEVRQPH